MATRVPALKNSTQRPTGCCSASLKYASSQLSVLLSILMAAILVHGRVPSAVLKSVMIPIVKNKNKHITEKENYRHICLANVFTKVIENVLLSRLAFDYMQSV